MNFVLSVVDYDYEFTFGNSVNGTLMCHNAGIGKNEEKILLRRFDILPIMWYTKS